MGTTTTKVERKCDSCGEWNTGKPRKCVHCGDFLDHRQEQEEKQEIEKKLKKLRDKAEFESKPLHMRIVLRVFMVLEFIFVTVVGGIAAFLFWLGG